MNDRIFKYVNHSSRASYEALGWIFAADLGPTHGSYSVMLEWPGPTAPLMPSEGDDEFLARTRFPLDRAFELARAVIKDATALLPTRTT